MPPFTGSRSGGGSVTLETSDLQIGAIEVKDGASDQRATVTAGGELLVSATDTIPVRETPTAATIDNVTDNDVTTAETIIAANADRKGFIVQNVEASGGIAARVTWDGSTPTATLGLQLVAGAALILSQPEAGVGAVQAISEDGSAVSLHVTEFD